MRSSTLSVRAGVHRRDVGRILVAIVLVAVDNRSHVRVGYVDGDTEGPIWIVILVAAVAGMLIGWLIRHRPRGDA